MIRPSGRATPVWRPLLLVYRVDRLSRKVRQLAQLAEELDRLDVVLRSATEPFDTGSADTDG